MINTIFTVLQVIFAVLLTGVILIQQKGAGLGAGFGGSGTLFTTKRGVDLILHKLTIVISILFFAVALATHLL
jgi:preprotein translocase subunit SecG